VFIKQRHFLDRHWQDKRPVPFGEEPPKSILQNCQNTQLLVFDEMREATGSRDIEDPLLDLFEYRIGYSLPTVATSNLKRAELETAIGSRLLDRLRKANFALLEFNFPSRRLSLNSEYLARCAARNKQGKPT
jgi:DNA replication protein DnaC